MTHQEQRSNIEAAKKVLTDAGYIGVNLLFHRSELEYRTEKELTPQQIENICQLIERKFDADIGINWGSIETQIENVTD